MSRDILLENDAILSYVREQSLFMTETGTEEIWEGVWKNKVSKEGF